MFKFTIVKNLKSTISLDGGMDIELVQVGAAQVDIELDGARIVSVKAPLGVVFAGSCGRLVREDYCDITDLCDLAALRKQLADEQEERDEVLIHTSPRVDMREWRGAA